MGSPNATTPLHRPCESRKGKTFKLVIRLTALKPCPFSVRLTLGIHSSRLWNLVGLLMSRLLARAYLMSCHLFFYTGPLVMQPGLTSQVSCSSPMLVAPAPQIAPDYNAGNFLSPLRASPVISSGYSSPMASTPALTPERELVFMGNAGVQLSPCLGTTQDWTGAWQDQGLLFVG